MSKLLPALKHHFLTTHLEHVKTTHLFWKCYPGVRSLQSPRDPKTFIVFARHTIVRAVILPEWNTRRGVVQQIKVLQKDQCCVLRELCLLSCSCSFLNGLKPSHQTLTRAAECCALHTHVTEPNTKVQVPEKEQLFNATYHFEALWNGEIVL